MTVMERREGGEGGEGEMERRGVKWEGGKEGRGEGGGGREVSGDRTMKRIRSSSTKRV